jgi:putative endonuclease
MAKHNHTGAFGEELAVAYFRQKGYEILHCNWRHRHWEVDIIASKTGKLHFIEIKTRRSARFGLPENSISPKKIQNLLNAASVYLERYPGWTKIQVDVLSIVLEGSSVKEFFLIEDVYNY